MTRLLGTAATVLVLALVAFLFGGCGGNEQAQTPTATSTARQASTSASRLSAANGPNNLPESLIGQVITPTDQSPAEFTKSLQNKRPTLVFFYQVVHTPQEGPSDDEKEKTEIDALQGRYRGQADFYVYRWDEGDRYKDLTTLLKVNTTPTVVIINKQNQVQRAWTGFVDSKTIEQGISEAVKS